MVVLIDIGFRFAVILQDKFLHHVAVHTDDCNMIGTLSVGLMIAEDPQRQEGSRHQKKNDEQIAPADHFQVFPHFPIPLFRKEKGKGKSPHLNPVRSLLLTDTRSID